MSSFPITQQQEIVNRKRNTLEIDLDDLDDVRMSGPPNFLHPNANLRSLPQHQNDSEFCQKVIRNTNRYLKLFAEAADTIAKETSATLHVI